MLLQQAGRLAAARVRFAAAAQGARDAKDAETFAVAALGLGGVWVHEHRTFVERAQVLSLQRQALGQLEASSTLAIRLRTRLAAEESYARGAPGAVLEALAEARALDDPTAVAEALSLTHHCLLGPSHAIRRLRLADELIDLSASTGRRLDALIGLMWRTVDLVLVGDPRAERSLHELSRREGLQPCDCIRYVVEALGVMQAIRAGRLDDGERLAQECYQLGLEVGDADALGWYGAQLLLIRWLQGRSAEMLPVVVGLARSPNLTEPNDAFDAAIAALAADAGRRDEARGALQRLRRRGLATTRNSSTWLTTLAGAIEASHLLGDEATAREAYELLAPYADLPIMASLGVACFGSAHRPLGLAALTLGELHRAVAHLEAAVDADLALANRPCHAMSSAYLAEALEGRAEPGDRERAAELRQAAVQAAYRLGMEARAASWSTRIDGSSRIHCQREGRAWRVTAGDRHLLVPNSLGIAYLAQLLEVPGVPIGALELASHHEVIASTIRQPILDERARAAYRQHVEELRAEIDDADDACDLERAARARIELDHLLEELARATGLAGRDRVFDDEHERARTSVQKAIKRALSSIAHADPAVGQALAQRVVTGRKCVYLAPGSAGTHATGTRDEPPRPRWTRWSCEVIQFKLRRCRQQSAPLPHSR